MERTLEYLERRCAINEMVLHDLGQLIAMHLPALQPQLRRMGEAWDAAIDKLDADIPETPNAIGQGPAACSRSPAPMGCTSLGDGEK